jgi:Fe-S cluster biogenesis protein NfuA
MYTEYYVDVEEMLGQTFKKVYADGESVTFENDEVKYVLYHDQDCCEHVYIEELIGDLEDLENWPLLISYEESNQDYSRPVNVNESYTWTFYQFATYKGNVTVRFLGTSNGYYSERVTCKKIIKNTFDKKEIDIYH